MLMMSKGDRKMQLTSYSCDLCGSLFEVSEVKALRDDSTSGFLIFMGLNPYGNSFHVCVPCMGNAGRRIHEQREERDKKERAISKELNEQTFLEQAHTVGQMLKEAIGVNPYEKLKKPKSRKKPGSEPEGDGD